MQLTTSLSRTLSPPELYCLLLSILCAPQLKTFKKKKNKDQTCPNRTSMFGTVSYVKKWKLSNMFALFPLFSFSPPNSSKSRT